MMHAEKCPVCKGSGRIEQWNNFETTAIPYPLTCHGCNGKGWIEVSDNIDEFHNGVYDAPPFKIHGEMLVENNQKISIVS